MSAPLPEPFWGSDDYGPGAVGRRDFFRFTTGVPDGKELTNGLGKGYNNMIYYVHGGTAYVDRGQVAGL